MRVETSLEGSIESQERVTTREGVVPRRRPARGRQGLLLSLEVALLLCSLCDNSAGGLLTICAPFCVCVC